MATEVLTMSLTEAAAWLVDHGLYSSLEAAYQAAPSWTSYATAEGGLNFLSSYGISYSGGAAAAASSTTESALAVAQNNVLQATGERITTMGTSLSRTAGGYSFNTLMAVDVGIVGAAAAPLLGVGLGFDFYNSNPEFWTKLSQRLLPFCYPGTTQIPTWAEIAGETFVVKVAKSVIDVISDVFEEEHISTKPFQLWDSPFGSLITGNPSTVIKGTDMTIVSGADAQGFGTSEPGEVPGRTIFLNKEVFYRGGGGAFDRFGPGWVVAGPDNVSLADALGLPINDVTNAEARNRWDNRFENPEIIDPTGGISSWTGTSYPTLPSANPIVVDSAGNVIDTVPISLPTNIPATWRPGQPAVSNDPNDYPDPAVTYDPITQVQPFISPWVLPDITTTTTTISPLPETSDPSNPIPPKASIRDLIPEIPPSGISPFPSMPSTDLSFSQNRGLVTVYHPTSQQLYSFEDWLWVTYNDATIDKIFNNPFDGVITLFELYCTPTDVGSRSIHSGFLDSGINSAIVSRYTQIDCGTLGIPEYYGNYFDYSPYTKAHIYLPFIGIVELNPDDIVGHGVNVTYRIDEYNGSCIAMITVAKSTKVDGEPVDYSCTMYQYSGNCAVELPLAGATQASIRAGMMQADAYQHAGQLQAGTQALGGLASLLTGNIGGAVYGLFGEQATTASAQATGLSHMLSGKSVVQKSGQFGASHGALGIKTPYIVITRPKQIKVANYQELYGFPAHKMVVIGDCTGFLRCREVHVVSATATDDEKSAIETLLKSGVYVTEE